MVLDGAKGIRTNLSGWRPRTALSAVPRPAGIGAGPPSMAVSRPPSAALTETRPERCGRTGELVGLGWRGAPPGPPNRRRDRLGRASHRRRPGRDSTTPGARRAGRPAAPPSRPGAGRESRRPWSYRFRAIGSCSQRPALARLGSRSTTHSRSRCAGLTRGPEQSGGFVGLRDAERSPGFRIGGSSCRLPIVRMAIGSAQISPTRSPRLSMSTTRRTSCAFARSAIKRASGTSTTTRLSRPTTAITRLVSDQTTLLVAPA